MIPVLHGVWASGGLAGDFEHIETQTVGSGGAASVTFSSIPGTYKHLQIRILGRTNAANARDYFLIRFNSDTTASYAYHQLSGDGTNASSSGQATTSAAEIGLLSTSAQSANIFGADIMDVLDYVSTTKYKTTRLLAGVDSNNTDGSCRFQSGLWMKTNAVTSITFAPGYATSFSQHSTFSLYGVK